ncbi:644_t:CDS:1, partial [Acaulospora morrowiae]
MTRVKKGERRSYSVEEKAAVVRFALASNNTKAAVHFDISKSMVGKWVKSLKTYLNDLRNRKSRRVGAGRKEAFPAEEKQLFVWFLQMREAALAVTYNSLKIEMLKIIAETVANTDDPTKKLNAINFKASSTWLKRFLHRNGLTLRHKTKISQQLPKDLEEKLLNFQRYIIRLRQDKNFPLSHIANMDETPVWFDMSGNLTVEEIGKKTVHVRTTGNDKNRFTVVLTCFADGQKHPPTVIFKGKRWPKSIPPPPPNINISFHEKGWMDEEGMATWTHDFAKKRPGGNKEPVLLVYDSFKAHLTDSIKKEMKKTNAYVVVIPGGLTSMCQPLDVSINRPFKIAIRRYWHEWMASGEVKKTTNGNLKRASLDIVCKWIISAWDEISPEIIQRAFR